MADVWLTLDPVGGPPDGWRAAARVARQNLVFPNSPNAPPAEAELIIEEADLPWPYVFYGPEKLPAPFFAFGKDPEADPALCACAKPAVLNFLAYRERYPNDTHLMYWSTDYLMKAPLNLKHFPAPIAALSFAGSTPLERIEFRQSLCHRCNQTTPTWPPAGLHGSWGDSFPRRFRAYVEQAAWHDGVNIPSMRGLPGRTPPVMRRELGQARAARGETSDLLRKRVVLHYENVARDWFGFKERGSSFYRETLLANTIAKLVAPHDSFRWARPAWMNGLELDIWVPELGIAVEHQGQQHFNPVKRFGGDDALAAIQERDRRKIDLCAAAGVRLYCFRYDEPIETEAVRTRLGLPPMQPWTVDRA